ncbi:MAG: sugar phosphate isomerase/epimerase, partial [Clostridiales bacterium]|nr:sugar phosphate isomerase/epimerase [Clostridiales bacterium]
MELGVCVSPDRAIAAAELGFDFIECSLSWLAGLDGAEYAAVRRRLAAAGIPVRSLNGMVPGSIRLTGPDVDRSAIDGYLRLGLGRAGEIGASVVVFGSGGARRVPGGFSTAQAWRQLAEFLAACEPIAAAAGIRVAIEPLRRAECNILNYVSEATALSALLRLPHVGALGDTYHMAEGGEPLSALAAAGELLYHVHVSHSLGPVGRTYPYPGDGEDYAA